MPSVYIYLLTRQSTCAQRSNRRCSAVSTEKQNYGPKMYSLAKNDRGVGSPSSDRPGSTKDDIYVRPMVLERG